MVFYPGREIGGDETMWWGPNISAVTDMLKTVGFKKIELVWQKINETANTEFPHGRATFHAWR